MKIFLTIAAIMSLVLMSFAVSGATLQEGTASASVTVNAFVDITISDTGSDGFNFGNLNLDSLNNPDDDQVDGTDVTPAATITRQATSNTDILIRLKGSNFISNGDNIPITNVDYDDDGTELALGSEAGLTQQTLQTAYPSGAGTDNPWATLTSGSPTVKIWFWLDIPASQAAGTYSSTFSFEGNSV